MDLERSLPSFTSLAPAPPARVRTKSGKNKLNTAAWTEEEVFHSGDLFYRRLKTAIDEATTAVDLDYYIFATDEIGQFIFDALIQASSRGVTIRVIVDGVGSANWIPVFGERAKAAGITFFSYHSLPIQSLIDAEDWPTLQVRALKFYRRANSRDHHKICLIDQSILFTGSFNISSNHTKEYANASCWRDTGVILRGPSVEIAQQLFETLWRARTRKRRDVKAARLAIQTSPWIRTNHTRRLRRQTRKELQTRITKSKERVWITTPYFAPDLLLMQALCAAGEAKRDVRILLPARSDVAWAPLLSRAYFSELLESGARIYLYQPSILHAKMTLIDDWVVIGSTNLNHRSLIHDLEFDVRLGSEKSCDEIENQFLHDLKCSKEINLEDCRADTFMTRVTGQLLYQFRYFF